MVHFSECSTVAANCNTETQIEMRDGTVEHFPEDARLGRGALGQLMEVSRPQLLAVLEPGERRLRDADHLALQAHVAVLA